MGFNMLRDVMDLVENSPGGGTLDFNTEGAPGADSCAEGYTKWLQVVVASENQWRSEVLAALLL